MRQLTENHQGDLLLTCFVEPKLVTIIFLVVAGAQITAIKTEDATQSGITLAKQCLFVADAFGNVHVQTLATVGLQLPGEDTATPIRWLWGHSCLTF